MMVVLERSMTIRGRRSKRSNRQKPSLLCNHRILMLMTMALATRLVLLPLTSKRTLRMALVMVTGQALKMIVMQKRLISRKQ